VNVTRSFARVASGASGSKLARSSMTQVAPRLAKVWAKYSELAWQSGITRRATSSWPNPSSSAVAMASSVLPAWLRIAPLGRPVVPDVYISAQGSVAVVGEDDHPVAPAEADIEQAVGQTVGPLVPGGEGQVPLRVAHGELVRPDPGVRRHGVTHRHQVAHQSSSSGARRLGP
jgi:hypothetical protein